MTTAELEGMRTIHAQHEAAHAVMSVCLRYPLKSVKLGTGVVNGVKSDGHTILNHPKHYFGSAENPRFDRLRRNALVTVAPEVWHLMTLMPASMLEIIAQRHVKDNPVVKQWCSNDRFWLRKLHKCLCRDLWPYEWTFPAFKRRLMKEAFELLSTEHMISSVFEVASELIAADDKSLSGKRVRQIVRECKSNHIPSRPLPAERFQRDSQKNF